MESYTELDKKLNEKNDTVKYSLEVHRGITRKYLFMVVGLRDSI